MNQRGTLHVITKDLWNSRFSDILIKQEDMDKLVMNYLMTEGHASTALEFFRESGTEPDIVLPTVDSRASAKMASLCDQMNVTLNIVSNHCNKMLCRDRGLLFQVLQQRFIESIRSRLIGLALQFGDSMARLVDYDPRFRIVTERTASLLISEDPYDSPARVLLGRSQLLKTADRIKYAILFYQTDEPQVSGADPLLFGLLDKIVSMEAELQKVVSYPLNELLFRPSPKDEVDALRMLDFRCRTGK